MSEPIDKRERSRYDVEDLFARLGNQGDGKVLNLSDQGLALEVPSWCQVGKTYPVTLSRDLDRLTLQGRIAWCKLSGTRKGPGGESRPVYLAGIELQAPPAQNARRLADFLESRAVIQVDGGVVGTFLGATGPRKLSVRRLTSRGLVIDTDVAREEGASLNLRLALGGQVATVPTRVFRVRENLETGARAPVTLELEYMALPEADRLELHRMIQREAGRG
jgi:hypothetical protein